MGAVKLPADVTRSLRALAARVSALERRASSVPDGVVVRSPNGTRWKLAVDDAGNVSATAL